MGTHTRTFCVLQDFGVVCLSVDLFLFFLFIDLSDFVPFIFLAKKKKKEKKEKTKKTFFQNLFVDACWCMVT